MSSGRSWPFSGRTLDDEIIERLERIGGTSADLDVCFKAAEAMLAFERWKPPAGAPNKRGLSPLLRERQSASEFIAKHCGAPAPGDGMAAPMSGAIGHAMQLERITTRIADLLRGCTLDEFLATEGPRQGSGQVARGIDEHATAHPITSTFLDVHGMTHTPPHQLILKP